MFCQQLLSLIQLPVLCVATHHPKSYSTFDQFSDKIRTRLLGFQANTSAKTPEELDQLTYLDTTEPKAFATQMMTLWMMVIYAAQRNNTLSNEEKSWIAPLPILFDSQLPGYVNIIKMMGVIFPIYIGFWSF